VRLCIELFSFCAFFCIRATLPVKTSRGIKKTKPLEVIFHHYPQFSEKNTLLVDDLLKNFIMNPKCGIQIERYDSGMKNEDEELKYLASYLEKIKTLENFSTVSHNCWQFA